MINKESERERKRMGDWEDREKEEDRVRKGDARGSRYSGINNSNNPKMD